MKTSGHRADTRLTSARRPCCPKKTTARGFRHHFKISGQQILVGKATVAKQIQTLTDLGIFFSLYIIKNLFENETRHNENEFTEAAVA